MTDEKQEAYAAMLAMGMGPPDLDEAELGRRAEELKSRLTGDAGNAASPDRIRSEGEE